MSKFYGTGRIPNVDYLEIDEPKGLMPRRDRDFHFPPFVSRDYARELSCKNERCFLNEGKGCSSPAAVRINEYGNCEIWVKQQEKLYDSRGR